MPRTSLVRFLLVLIPALLVAGCVLRDPLTDSFPSPPPWDSLPTLPSGPSLQVLVLGDWGTGGEGQRALAETIAETHRDSPPDFVITVGDNFYEEGVTGPDDPIWETHFESVYRGAFWEALVFQAILGNHDHYGNPDGQIQYSDVSPQWDMPSRHYAFERPIPGGGSALFVALDTEPFAMEDSTGPAQQEWADSVLRNASADWIVVGGHHPVITGGWHEPDGSLKDVVQPLLRNGVDIYVSGHNHDTELLRTQMGALQAVCGGGGGLDNPHRVRFVPGTIASFTNGGWCLLRLWPEVMAVELFDRDGGLQFRHLIGKEPD